jgi:hypothetical protein
MATLSELAINRFVVSAIPDDAKAAFLAMLELQQRCREDIVLFFNVMLGLPTNEFQEKFLRRSTTPRKLWMEKWEEPMEDIGGLLFGKNIAFPSNQIGKTVMIAGKHIWFNYYKIGLDLDEKLINTAHYSTLNISPVSRQTRACYQYVKDILSEQFMIHNPSGRTEMNKLHPLLKDFLAGENSTLGELRFRNKSVMYTVPTGHDQASSLAGAQFGYISYDECAQSLHLEQELGAKIMSRLIRYGTGLDLISTPETDSASHQYYLHIVKMGLRGKDGWYAQGGHLDQNVFIRQEQRDMAKAELLKTDKNKYRQVVKGEFVSSGSKFFDSLEIENMWKMERPQACIPGRKYLIVSDWGMSDTGDDSVHYALDYTDWLTGGKIKLVAHEEMKGGSPHMQFALLRTFYESFCYTLEGDTFVTKPIYVMDAKALGGVLIKKLLAGLNPKAFEIEKDEALLLTKKAMSEGRDFYESEVDASIIERNPDYGVIESYYIEKLADQLGLYHIDDKKLTQDHVMTLVMGVSYIVKKIPRAGKPAALDRLAGYNAGISRTSAQRRQVGLKELFNSKH